MFDAERMEAEVLARIVDESRWSPVIALLAGANLRFYGLVHRCARKPGPWVKTGAWRPGILPASATPAGWCHGEGTKEEVRTLAKAMRQAPEPGHLKLVADQPRRLARLVTIAKKIEGLVGLTLVARQAIEGSDLPLALMGMRLKSLTLGVSGHGTGKEWKDTLAAMKLDRLEVRPPKPINRLLRVPDQEEPMGSLAAEQFPENAELHRVGVLKLVDQGGLEPFAERFAQSRSSGTLVRHRPFRHTK